jgi:hypothetical protein
LNEADEPKLPNVRLFDNNAMVRRLRLGVLALLVCLLALAGGSAYAAKPKQAVFRVTLTATLTKQWTYVRDESEGDCMRTTRGVGRWQAKLSTRRGGLVRVVAAGGGRVRFSGAVRGLAGTATRSGSMTTSAEGPPPCERVSRQTRCGLQRKKFRGGLTSVGNPRKGVLQLGRLRRAEAIRSFGSTCLQEPSDIRTIRTDLPLATGPLDARDFFDSNVPRSFVSGDAEQVTTIESEVDGRVTERVRWKVNFARVSR